MTNNPIERSIVLLADGARSDVFFELLNTGKLPNINKYLVQNGFATTGVTSFPSTTGPAYLPFLTGACPSTCNIPGIRWFDKTKYANSSCLSLQRYRSYVGLESFLMSKDIKKGIKTVFEMIPESYSIFNSITRGARNKTKYMRIWYWYYAHLTDHWSLADKAALKKTLQVLNKGCKYLFTVFPGIDEYSHLTHPRSEAAFERYIWLDNAIGEIVRLLKRKNQWKSTEIWLVSDHGLSKTDKHFCLNTFLEQHGLPAFYYPLIFNKKGKLSASMVSGNGMAHIYLKNKDGWDAKTNYNEINQISPSLINDLIKEPAIDIIACMEAENSIRIMSKKGLAMAKLEANNIISYSPVKGDPFGYAPMPEKLNHYELLCKTFSSDYPNAPLELAMLFKSSRTGDIVLSASPGYDLRLKYENPEHKASHGSLHKSHMLVPILCNRQFKNKIIRTVDILPTILKSLNLPVPDNIDGQALES